MRENDNKLKIYEYDTLIKKQDSIDAAFVEFPYNVQEEFGTRGQVKVKATFDGYEYQGSLVKMGYHCHIIGITQKIRQEIGKQSGDMVHVTITKDDAPRIIEVPEDFKTILHENEEAQKCFDSLSYTNQKKFAEWIESAKKTETRDKRIKESISMLLDGVKHP